MPDFVTVNQSVYMLIGFLFQQRFISPVKNEAVKFNTVYDCQNFEILLWQGDTKLILYSFSSKVPSQLSKISMEIISPS